MKIFQSLLFSVLFVSAIFFTGCSEEPTSVTPVNTPGLSKLTLPAGAAISSATLNVYVEDATGNNVTVHKVNVPWTEAETWNTFFGKPPAQFDAGSLGNFNLTAGLHTVDITALVQAWVAGTTTNYGVLLNQHTSAAGYATIRSSEYIGTDQPYLEVTYSVGGGGPVTVQEPAFIDTYIWSIEPNNSFGNSQYLNIRHINAERKYILIQFDIESAEVEVECNTAYAYGNTLANCFIGYPGINANNWGWANLIPDVTESYEFPIYAGAAGCDLTKGTLVGTLYVDYDATTNCVTIEYEIDAPYDLDEFHLWVDENEPLPQKKNGDYTTSPGQFNHNGEPNPTTICNIDGPFWVTAHFGVCNEVVQ